MKDVIINYTYCEVICNCGNKMVEYKEIDKDSGLIVSKHRFCIKCSEEKQFFNDGAIEIVFGDETLLSNMTRRVSEIINIDWDREVLSCGLHGFFCTRCLNSRYCKLKDADRDTQCGILISQYGLSREQAKKIIDDK